jgi:aryl-alcohol dehydrogenase-like predicted oxidoreductase
VLVQQGKILYAGSSNFACWHIAQAMETERARHIMGIVSEQTKYNLLTRTVELEVLPACRHYGVGIIPWSPLAGGLLALSGRAGGAAEDQRRNSDWARADREKRAAELGRYAALCKELGQEPADVALAWLLHRPEVTSPIIGPRTLEQLDTSLKALEIKLDEPTLAKLDEIFPGPGKPAPEAYAW